MAGAWRLAVVVIALAATARAEDPPPAKHVNHVTPEAQAAIDRYRSLVMHPLAGGLKSMTCSLVVTGFRTRERASCEYGADDGLVVKFPPGLEKAMSDVGTDCVGFALRGFFQERFELSPDEFDAELVVKDGRSTILMTEYEDGKFDFASEFELDAEGLVAKRSFRPGPQAKWPPSTTTFTWAKRGELRHVAAVDVALSGTDPDAWTSAMEFAEENGAWIPIHVATTYRWSDGTKKSFDVYVADLVVNGTAVDLPTPWKHDNKVSPEAQAAIDAFRRLVYRPDDHGVSSAAGAIVALGLDGPVRATFEFTKTRGVRATDTQAIEEAQRRRKLVGNAVGYPLDAAFDASAVLLEDAFDATIEMVEAARVLAITAYRDGKPLYAERCTLDENGLLRRREWRDLADRGREDYVTTYAWTSFPDGWCLAGLDIVHAEPRASRQTYAFRYSDVGGVHLVSSYDVRYFGPETVTLTCHVADLVVDGAKVDLPTPWKHVNKVSPDARAAIDRYESLVDRAPRRVIKSLTALVAIDGVAGPPRWQFEFKAPRRAAVSPTSDWKPTPAQSNQARYQLDFPIGAVVDPPALAEEEFDAEFVERDGVRTLVVSRFRDGAPDGSREATFDEVGLLSSFAAAAVDRRIRFGYSWTKEGAKRRADTVTMDVEEQSGRTRTVTKAAYSDVAGVPFPVSFVSDVHVESDGKTTDRTQAFRLLDFVVDGRKLDVSDPTAHANVVSPEAQTALARFEKLVYRPIDHGFRSASGMFLPGGIRFAITPQRIDLHPPDEDPGGTWASIATGIRPMLLFPYAGLRLAESPQFDAEFVEKLGRRTLVVTTFARGVAATRFEAILDDRGLVVSLRAVGVAPSSASASSEFRFAWTAVGDQWQIERVELWDTTRALHTTVAFAFADASGLHVPVSLRWMFTNVPGVPGSAAFSIDDFVLNDAKVALPKVVLHENSVTPEAQTLMDAYARIVDRPIAHGLVTASGDVVPAGEKPVRRRFSFTAPLFLAVTLPPPVKNDSPEGRAVAASTRLALLLAIDGIRLAESLEYDARVVERDGVRVLEVVEFKSGARSATSEFTFDADGLVATLRRRDGADPAAPTSDVAFRFEWEKSDGSCRVRAAELTVGFTRKRYEIGRSKIDGVDFVTSYSVVVVENGTSTTFRYCVEDLVLNGKKVEASKPAADPPTDGGKK